MYSIYFHHSLVHYALLQMKEIKAKLTKSSLKLSILAVALVAISTMYLAVCLLPYSQSRFEPRPPWVAVETRTSARSVRAVQESDEMHASLTINYSSHEITLFLLVLLLTISFSFVMLLYCISGLSFPES